MSKQKVPNSESPAPSVDTFRTASILRLTSTERQVIIEALKISRVSIIGEGGFSDAAYEIKKLLEKVQEHQEIWLIKRGL